VNREWHQFGSTLEVLFCLRHRGGELRAFATGFLVVVTWTPIVVIRRTIVVIGGLTVVCGAFGLRPFWSRLAQTDR
jgi:hypothetical protein